MAALLAIQEWLPEPLRNCLMSQSAKLLARITPEGRQCSRALHQWMHIVGEIKERKNQARRVLASVSPEGRAQAKCLRAWATFAADRRRYMAKLQSALARMTPEGRAKYSGLMGFKARTPTWVEGPYRYVSDEGFWVTSARARERESVVGTPQVRASISTLPSPLSRSRPPVLMQFAALAPCARRSTAPTSFASASASTAAAPVWSLASPTRAARIHSRAALRTSVGGACTFLTAPCTPNTGGR